MYAISNIHRTGPRNIKYSGFRFYFGFHCSDCKFIFIVRAVEIFKIEKY